MERTIRVDDIDGKTTANVEETSFMLDGVDYVIDLGTLNSRRLRKALAPYIAVARRPRRTPPGGGKLALQKKRPSPAKKKANPLAPVVRAWAQQQGIDVPQRGRVPAALYQQFEDRAA